MFYFLKIHYFYKLAFLHEFFLFPIADKALKDASESLNNRITYRFPMSAPKDQFISLRILKFILLNIFKTPTCICNGTNSGVAVFDVNLQGKEVRTNYIERLSGDRVDLWVSRGELIKQASLLFKVLTLAYVLLVSPFVILFSFFSVNKLLVPYHLLCSIEAKNMYAILKKNRIKNLHYFCIYETDSNLMAYVLMKSGIHVNKIPSEVPLQFLNRTIVSDSLSFCFRYQEEEYKNYRSTMHVKSTQHWIPEGSFNLEACYNNANRSTEPNTIGFYSSGMWLRSEEDIMDLHDADKYEEELVRLLVAFINENPKHKLIVFLHPIEKRNLAKTKDHYGHYSIPISFADPEIPNSELFKSADVVTSLYSTLAFERIFWGFKTIIFPLGQNEFPIPESSFEGVCVKTKSDLFAKLKMALEVSTEDYFVITKTANYRYLNYDCFKKNAA